MLKLRQLTEALLMLFPSSAARLGVLILLTSSGCNGGQSGNEGNSFHDGSMQPPNDAGNQSIYYDAITGSSTSAVGSPNLCNLVRLSMFETGGLYRVKKLRGEYEEDLWEPGSMAPFTYVDLELIEPWFNSTGNVTARISGGRVPSGSIALWRVSLALGEVVGLLLVDRVPENRGYFGMHPLGTFKRVGDGFTNGQLLRDAAVSENELGRIIAAIANADLAGPCPFDAPATGGPPIDDTDGGN